jgi:hypothetical protein
MAAIYEQAMKMNTFGGSGSSACAVRELSAPSCK